MHRTRERRATARSLAVIVLAIAAVVGLGGAPQPAAAAGLPAWHGGIDLYRSGVFSTQKTFQWCTAADVQIMRNIVDRGADHSRSNQQRYFAAMRAHNRYDIPVADGVDPAGWTYGLRRYVDSRYRLVSSGSFNSALRSAVTSLRKTNLPVGITVAHGGHAWVLTGFTATADPAKTTRFTVTSVRVTGPLWGLQSRSYGYDMRPDTKLTPKQLAGFFTPWHYAKLRMAWEGRWVSIQPIGKAASPATPATPKPTTKPTPRPSVPPSPASSGSPSPAIAAEPTPGSSGPGGVAIAPLGGSASPSSAAGAAAAASLDADPVAEAIPSWITAGVVLVLAALLVVAAAATRNRSRLRDRRRRPGPATR